MERITNAINTFVIQIYFFFNAFFFIQLYFLKALFMQLYASMGSRVDRKPLASEDASTSKWKKKMSTFPTINLPKKVFVHVSLVKIDECNLLH